MLLMPCLSPVTLSQVAHTAGITWINPARGSFKEPAHWSLSGSPGAVPTALDNAIITLDGTYDGGISV